VDRYALTDAQFRSLATGYGSAEAVGLLVDAQVTKRRLLLLAVLERAPERLADVLPLLGALDREAPERMRWLLRHPYLDAWFAGPASRTAHETGYLARLAASAAATGGVPFRLTVPTPDSVLVLPALGAATGVGAGTVELGFDGTDLAVAGSAGTLRLTAPFTTATEHWRPVPTVTLQSPPPFALMLDDLDPYRDRYPQPPTPRLSAGAVGRLTETVDAAWATLSAEQPDHARAMAVTLRALVPLSRPPGGAQVSAAARDAFGAIGLSAPDDPDVLAELLVHEFQHGKLGALLDLVELCRPGGAARHYAPWRPDPRPAAALMQGVYAFAGVAGFWRTRRRHVSGLRSRAAEFRFAYWRARVGTALDGLLASGELTGHGRAFFTELRGTVRRWHGEPVPPGAVTAAELCGLVNRIRWRLANQRADDREIASLLPAWRAGRPPPTVSPPAIVAGAPLPGPDPADEVERAWVDGSARDPERLRAVLRAAVDREADAGPVAACVGLALDGHPVAERRPELLRALLAEPGPTGPASRARWLAGGAAA
jgi:HEXXH motif-containing protein